MEITDPEYSGSVIGIALDLSIIIVNYNVKEFLQNLIYSIEKAAGSLRYEIIVVDNASSDGSVEFICEKFPNVILIANQENVGFSRANNMGLKIAKGKYHLLLNPDTLVQENTFTEMIRFFEENPETGLAGCKILNPDGTLQLACRRSFPGPWTSFSKVTGLSTLFPNSRIFARYNLTYRDENETYEVDAVSGSFMMIKREVYEKIGGLDEQFFMYGEDLDWCYRIQKGGYKVYYVHTTQIIHYKGESTRRSGLDETTHFYNAMHLFVKKHFSSSLLVEAILRSAIIFRKFFAFLGARRLIVLSVITDFILFNISLFLAEKIYESVRVDWTGFPGFSYPVIYTVPALIHIITGFVTGIYKKDSFSVLKNFGALFVSFLLLSSITFFFKEYAYSRAVILITYIILFFVLSSWRIFVKLFFRIGTRPEEIFNKRSLVVGVSDDSVKVAHKLNSRHTEVRKVAGLIAFSQKQAGSQIDGFEVLGSIENITKVIREKKINEVIFPHGEISYEQMMEIVSSSHGENVDFKITGQSMDFLVGKTSVSVLEEVPLIELSYSISSPLMKFLKALFDYTAAVLVLLFVYPFIYLYSRLSRKETDFRKFILSVPEIFTGKVSFVGPQNPSRYKNLYMGKRGLTGLWFIEDPGSGEVDKLDIFYAKNQNIWLDLEILGKSINRMWEGKHNG
jgi:O-antigen biosynthesis protein